jgi:hypothetical protein
MPEDTTPGASRLPLLKEEWTERFYDGGKLSLRFLRKLYAIPLLTKEEVGGWSPLRLRSPRYLLLKAFQQLNLSGVVKVV